MNCERARELIDLRVQGEHTDAADGAAFDAHLTACAACTAELAALRAVRARLAPLASEQPTESEIDKMWQMAAAGIGGGSTSTVAVAIRPRGSRRAILEFAAASAGIAAVLGAAFIVGELQFDHGLFKLRSISAIYSNVNDAAGQYGADDASGFGIPVHPLQFARAHEVLADRSETAIGLDSDFALSGNGEVFAANTSVPESFPAQFRDAAEVADAVSKFQDDRSEPSQTESHVRRRGRSASSTAPAADISAMAPAAAPNFTEEMRRQLGGALTMAAPTAGGDSFQIERATPPPAAQPAPVSPPASAKIIKTGDLAVEVAEYEPAVRRVQAIVAEHGAYVADAQVQEATGGSLAGRIVVRCGPERFEALFAALKAVGRVESENVKAADVTAEYVDLEARIRGNKITEERLHDLVKNKTIVDKVTALLEVERELTRVRSVIEQLEGQLRVMADRVALSTITVALREPQRTVPNASLSVEIGVLDEAAEALSGALAAHDGRLVRGETSKHGDGSRFGTYQMTVPLAKFADLLAAIESLGRVAVRQVNDRQFGDVTAPWAQRVRCNVSLTLSEQVRQLPAGSLNIEVDGREDAVAKVSALLPEFDAAIVSNRTAQQSAAAQSAELQIRVPARRFAELVEALRALGRTVSRNVTGEAGAIIGGAAETPCDLTLTLSEMPREVPRGAMAVEVAGFEPARDALSRLIKDKGAQVLGSASQQRNDGTWIGQFRLGVAAGRMEEVVAGLEKLGRVAARSINGLGLSDLSRVDPDAQGVIEVTLAEKSTIAPAPDQASATIRGKLREALTGLYTSLGLIAYGLIVIAPWLVITLLLAWVVTRARRRRAAKA